MATTIKSLIEQCLPYAGLPASPIQNEVLDIAIASVNFNGKYIWQQWPFDDEKTGWLELTPDADGIVTLPANIDIVRAVVADTDYEENAHIPAQDPVTGAVIGNTTRSGRFEHLPSAAGRRRIQVEAGTESVKVCALYDLQPYTTANYTTETWPLDRALGALRQFVIDDLRRWSGLPTFNQGGSELKSALAREVIQQQNDMRVVPSLGMFWECDE